MLELKNSKGEVIALHSLNNFTPDMVSILDKDTIQVVLRTVDKLPFTITLKCTFEEFQKISEQAYKDIDLNI